MKTISSTHGAFRILAAAFLMTAVSTAGFSSCSTIGNAEAGAKGEVKGNIRDVNQRAQSVFKDLNIHLVNTGSEDSGREQTIGGTSSDEKVTVQMTNTGENTTQVEVTAKRGSLTWDKDYADQVLSKIFQSS